MPINSGQECCAQTVGVVHLDHPQRNVAEASAVGLPTSRNVPKYKIANATSYFEERSIPRGFKGIDKRETNESTPDDSGRLSGRVIKPCLVIKVVTPARSRVSTRW